MSGLKILMATWIAQILKRAVFSGHSMNQYSINGEKKG